LANCPMDKVLHLILLHSFRFRGYGYGYLTKKIGIRKSVLTTVRASILPNQMPLWKMELNQSFLIGKSIFSNARIIFGICVDFLYFSGG
jgi:hypothetical protein